MGNSAGLIKFGQLLKSGIQELVNIDNDVKGKFNQYTGVKTNLATLHRKQT